LRHGARFAWQWMVVYNKRDNFNGFGHGDLIRHWIDFLSIAIIRFQRTRAATIDGIGLVKLLVLRTLLSN